MIVYLIFSFFFEIIIGRLFNYNFIIPLFFFISLIQIYPLFIKDKYKYFILLFFLGFLYDIVITNMISINSLLFLLIGLINTLYVKNFSSKFISDFLFSSCMLVLYELILVIFVIFLDISNVSILTFGVDILYILGLNMLYYFITNIILKRIKR